MSYNYYKEQLDQIEVQEGFNPDFVFTNGVEGKTKYLSLNKESIVELRKFLDKIEPTLA